MTAAILRAGDVVRGERGQEYYILEWRGEGSYSRVYRAQVARRPGALCAVKLAKREIPGAAERVERERSVRARLRHPRLVEMLGAGRWEDVPFVVLAWIEGWDLRRLIERQRRLPLVTALGYLHDAAAAVAALHAADLAHGDLRPNNVLVEDDTQRAVLTDLGEAIERRDPRYAARLRDDRCALGTLLAFMLTGAGPDSPAHRLSTANGHNPDAVRLWEDARADRLTAAALHKETATLLKAIGAARRS